MTQRLFFGLIGILVLLGLLLPAPLLARTLPHGGGLPRVSDVEAGPYRLFIWAEPEPALTGEINFTVAVTQIPASAGAQADPVLDADVQIRMARTDGPAAPISGQATHAQAVNKLMYENYLAVPSAGQWRATVTVTSPQGTGSTAFEFEVLPGPGIDWTWPAVGGLGLVILIVAVRFLRRPAAAKTSDRPGPKRTKRV